MYCTQCGAEAPSAAKFCHACGSRLLTAAETSERGSPSDPSLDSQQQGAGSPEPLSRLTASVSTWRCSHCGQLNRPGKVVCACGHPHESAQRQEPTPNSIQLPIQAGGHPSFTGRGADIFGLDGLKMFLWYISIVGIPVGWIYTLRWTFKNIQLPGGSRLSFKGKAGDVYGYFVLMFFVGGLNRALNRFDQTDSEVFGSMDPVLLGFGFLLFGFCLLVAQALLVRELYKWVCANVIASTGSHLRFIGGVGPYLGWFVLQVLSMFTIIGWAWVQTAFLRWQLKRTRTARTYLGFRGSGFNVLWRTVVAMVASLLILPIPWMVTWMYGWFVENVELHSVDAAAGVAA